MNPLMRSTDEYGGIYWQVLGLYWYSRCSISWVSLLLCYWVSLLHEPSQESRASSGCSISWVFPLKEDGTGASPGDLGCSVSLVSLLQEPSWESRASSGTS